MYKKYILLIILTFGFSAYPNSSSGATPKTFHKERVMMCRVTYYNGFEDRFGSKVACSPRIKAKEGITVAAHFNFPFNTQIEIPELKKHLGDSSFIVQDRGRAVTSKRASRGKCYVFDVFLSGNNKRLRNFAKKTPQYMKVIVK